MKGEIVKEACQLQDAKITVEAAVATFSKLKHSSGEKKKIYEATFGKLKH